MLEQFSTHADGCQGRYEERDSSNVAWALPLGLLGSLLHVRGDCVCLTGLLEGRKSLEGPFNIWKWYAVPPLAQCDYTDSD